MHYCIYVLFYVVVFSNFKINCNKNPNKSKSTTKRTHTFCGAYATTELFFIFKFFNFWGVFQPFDNFFVKRIVVWHYLLKLKAYHMSCISLVLHIDSLIINFLIKNGIFLNFWLTFEFVYPFFYELWGLKWSNNDNFAHVPLLVGQLRTNKSVSKSYNYFSNCYWKCDIFVCDIISLMCQICSFFLI